MKKSEIDRILSELSELWLGQLIREIRERELDYESLYGETFLLHATDWADTIVQCLPILVNSRLMLNVLSGVGSTESEMIADPESALPLRRPGELLRRFRKSGIKLAPEGKVAQEGDWNRWTHDDRLRLGEKEALEHYARLRSDAPGILLTSLLRAVEALRKDESIGVVAGRLSRPVFPTQREPTGRLLRSPSPRASRWRFASARDPRPTTFPNWDSKTGEESTNQIACGTSSSTWPTSSGRADAETLLRRREGTIARGLPVIVNVEKTLFEELLEDVVVDYSVKGRRTLDAVRRRIGKHVEPFFRNSRAMSITPADVSRFIVHRQDASVASRLAPRWSAWSAWSADWRDRPSLPDLHIPPQSRSLTHRRGSTPAKESSLHQVAREDPEAMKAAAHLPKADGSEGKWVHGVLPCVVGGGSQCSGVLDPAPAVRAARRPAGPPLGCTVASERRGMPNPPPFPHGFRKPHK